MGKMCIYMCVCVLLLQPFNQIYWIKCLNTTYHKIDVIFMRFSHSSLLPRVHLPHTHDSMIKWNTKKKQKEKSKNQKWNKQKRENFRYLSSPFLCIINTSIYKQGERCRENPAAISNSCKSWMVLIGVEYICLYEKV